MEAGGPSLSPSSHGSGERLPPVKRTLTLTVNDNPQRHRRRRRRRRIEIERVLFLSSSLPLSIPVVSVCASEAHCCSGSSFSLSSSSSSSSVKRVLRVSIEWMTVRQAGSHTSIFRRVDGWSGFGWVNNNNCDVFAASTPHFRLLILIHCVGRRRGRAR